MEVNSEYSGKFNYIACTPSVFARTNLIHLQGIGEYCLDKSELSSISNYSAYLFFIITYGSCGLEYDGNCYTLSQGSCGFLDCKRKYFYRVSEDQLSQKFIYFYGPNMSGIYEKYVEEGGLPCFCAGDFEVYENIYNQLYQLVSEQAEQKEMLIYEKLTSLLALLMKDGKGMAKRTCRSSQKQDIQAVKDYLDQSYHEKITLDSLAEKFYINKFYLTRLFKEQFGFSINSYLIQVRISHARQMLRFTNMSIEKIGQSCGINDANYFARLFKKLEGMSPGEYRLSSTKQSD